MIFQNRLFYCIIYIYVHILFMSNYVFSLIRRQAYAERKVTQAAEMKRFGAAYFASASCQDPLRNCVRNCLSLPTGRRLFNMVVQEFIALFLLETDWECRLDFASFSLIEEWQKTPWRIHSLIMFNLFTTELQWKTQLSNLTKELLRAVGLLPSNSSPNSSIENPQWTHSFKRQARSYDILTHIKRFELFEPIFFELATSLIQLDVLGLL